MTRGLRARFWIEATLSTISSCLFVLTLVWRDWIEATTGYDPDHHGGSAEGAIIAGLLVITLGFSLLARAQLKNRVGDRQPAAQGSGS
jgi:hypothetical protein